MTRWSLVISEETDRALRTYLAQNGGKKGDMSFFVEKAVKEKLFHLTVSRLKERNRDHDQEAMLEATQNAVESVRAARH